MKIAAFTMCHNEHNMLPVWIRHYASLVGRENIYVIDHGSTDGSTSQFKDNVTRLPRRYNGADIRLPIVCGFQKMLLAEYDVVIYTDCDEFLVIDPDVSGSLRDALTEDSSEFIRCLGADLIHLPDLEPDDLDFNLPILEQRRYWYFSRFLSKPIVTRALAEWSPGFHNIKGNENLPPNPAFLLLHLRWVDLSHARARMEITRSMLWSPKAMSLGWGAHARQGDDGVLAYFKGQRSRFKSNVADKGLFAAWENREAAYGPVVEIYPRLRGLL